MNEKDKNSKKLTMRKRARAGQRESITAGPRALVVMQDVWLMEKMAHFNRESSQSAGCTQKAGAHTANSR
jgi:catalase